MGLDKVDYDDRQHAVYARGRPLTVLDLGSGTGRFTPMLADTFGGPTYGVEPSARMRQVAAGHPGVSYLPGSAERIPLGDGTCDLVVMFLMLQHCGPSPSSST